MCTLAGGTTIREHVNTYERGLNFFCLLFGSSFDNNFHYADVTKHKALSKFRCLCRPIYRVCM